MSEEKGRNEWRDTIDGSADMRPAGHITATQACGAMKTGPEQEMIIECTRFANTSSERNRIKELAKNNLDWDVLLNLVDTNRVKPLVHQRLTGACADLVCSDVLARLQEYRLFIKDRNERNLKEMIRILGELDRCHLRAIPYKGAVLAMVAYQDLSIRHFADIDILIDKKDLHRIKELMLSIGYEPTGAEPEQHYLRSKHEYPLQQIDGDIIVEPQWAISKRYFEFAVDFDCLWERRVQVGMAGTTVPSMSLEDMLTIVCVHASKGLWAELKWIVDIAWLLETHRQIEWPRVMRQARAAGVLRVVFVGLLLADSLYAVPLPTGVRRMIRRDPKAGEIVSYVLSHLFTSRRTTEQFREDRERIHVVMRERWRDRAALLAPRTARRIAARLRPDDTDEALLPLPEAFRPIHYVVHMARLAPRYCRKLLRM